MERIFYPVKDLGFGYIYIPVCWIMTKILYLLRHANSAEKGPLQDDRDEARPLSSAGAKESMLIGSWLAKNNIKPDLICSSSALRAEMTSELVAKANGMGTEKIILSNELYNASARTFLEYIHKTDELVSSLMVVGHNPTISYVAEYITRQAAGMTTGSLAIIRINTRMWKDVSERTGTLINYIEPSAITE